MEGAWSEHSASILFPWVSAAIAVFWLLRNNRKNRNPLEWSRVDRCLLVIALFCFVGGTSNLIMGAAVSLYFEQLPLDRLELCPNLLSPEPNHRDALGCFFNPGPLAATATSRQPRLCPTS